LVEPSLVWVRNASRHFARAQARLVPSYAEKKSHPEIYFWASPTRGTMLASVWQPLLLGFSSKTPVLFWEFGSNTQIFLGYLFSTWHNSSALLKDTTIAALLINMTNKKPRRL